MSHQAPFVPSIDRERWRATILSAIFNADIRHWNLHLERLHAAKINPLHIFTKRQWRRLRKRLMDGKLRTRSR